MHKPRNNKPWRNHYTKRPDVHLVFQDNLGDVILLDKMLVLYKSVVDLFFYVLAGTDENEVMLSGVLGSFQDALSILLK